MRYNSKQQTKEGRRPFPTFHQMDKNSNILVRDKPKKMFQVMVMELLSQWGITGFMDHVSKVEEFYKDRRDKMQLAAEKHLTGNFNIISYSKSISRT
jgi:DNA-binding transcriptional MocR family regulator